MTRPRKLVAALALAAGMCLAATGPARADWEDWDSDGGEPDEGAGIALAVLTSTTHFIYATADIYFAAKGRWLTSGWGWTQTLWGGLNVAASVVMVPLGVIGKDRSWLGLGIGTGILGTWFMVHGIISLVKHYARVIRHRPPMAPPPGVYGPPPGAAPPGVAPPGVPPPGIGPPGVLPPGLPPPQQDPGDAPPPPDSAPGETPPPPPPPPPGYMPELTLGPIQGGLFGSLCWQF